MERAPIHILLVEDNPADARLLQLLLAEKPSFPSQWTHVQRLSQAIEHLMGDQIEVVLLDLSLPDTQGINTLTALQPYAAHLPIIVITGLNDETMALNAMQSGAQDYLVKGQIDSELLARTLRYSIERSQAEEYIRYQSNLIQNVSDAIIGTDMNFMVTSWNPAAEQMYGWYVNEVIGKQIGRASCRERV